MYYKGKYSPREEATRSSWSSSESTFTQEIYDNAQPGDLYFSQTASAVERFLVPVNAGEHGFTKAQLIPVTHRRGDHGWGPYDKGVNLVIRVDADGLVTGVRRVVEQTLQQTPLGRVVGREALGPMVDAVVRVLGCDGAEVTSSEEVLTLNPDPLSQARKALIDLLKWAPSRGYDDEIGRLGAEVDRVGFAKDAESYAALINGNGNGDSTYERSRRPLPLLGQPVSYAVVGGKDAGRGLQGVIERLKTAVCLLEDDH